MGVATGALSICRFEVGRQTEAGIWNSSGRLAAGGVAGLGGEPVVKFCSAEIWNIRFARGSTSLERSPGRAGESSPWALGGAHAAILALSRADGRERAFGVHNRLSRDDSTV